MPKLSRITRVALSQAYRVLAPFASHPALKERTRHLILCVLDALDEEMALRPLDVEPTDPGAPPDFEDGPTRIRT